MPSKMEKPLNNKVMGCGYYIHYSLPEGKDSNISLHTHGLVESKKHKDLQIIFPATSEIIRSSTTYDTFLILPSNLKLLCEIVKHLVSMIDEGAFFKSGMEIYEPFCDCKIKFMNSIENGREVLKLIINDNKE